MVPRGICATLTTSSAAHYGPARGGRPASPMHSLCVPGVVPGPAASSWPGMQILGPIPEPGGRIPGSGALPPATHICKGPDGRQRRLRGPGPSAGTVRTGCRWQRGALPTRRRPVRPGTGKPPSSLDSGKGGEPALGWKRCVNLFGSGFIDLRSKRKVAWEPGKTAWVGSHRT